MSFMAELNNKNYNAANKQQEKDDEDRNTTNGNGNGNGSNDNGNNKNTAASASASASLLSALKLRTTAPPAAGADATVNNSKNKSLMMAALQQSKSKSKSKSAATASGSWRGVTEKALESKAAKASSSATTKEVPLKTMSYIEEPFLYYPSLRGNEEGNDDEEEGNDEGKGNGDGDEDGFFTFISNKETSSDNFIPRIDIETEKGTKPSGSGSDIQKIITTFIEIPLAPLIYRVCDYTFEKAIRSKQSITVNECVSKLGILRALKEERKNFNVLLESKLDNHNPMDDDEYGKTRFIELLSNYGGVARNVIEILLKETTKASDKYKKYGISVRNECIVNVSIDGLNELLDIIENVTPSLEQARNEIHTEKTVSFYPGLGELFCPGSKLITYPDGMEGSPLGVNCVQSWYTSDYNKATNKTKQRFILVIEYIISVGNELVFVAMTDVYPEFHDTSRNVPLKDLNHRKLNTTTSSSKEDSLLLQRLQQRGEFYASVATKNHFLEYYADSFFPILKGGSSGGWSSNAVRPLSKGGRVMVDVKRGILEGHIPIRSSGSGSGDATSDTVKEAIKLFESSKRTGIAVPFRTCILPDIFGNNNNNNTSTSTSTSTKPKTKNSNNKSIIGSSISFTSDTNNGAASTTADDRERLWMSWPMIVGFSFTARVWGKLLLGMPKLTKNIAAVAAAAPPSPTSSSPTTEMLPLVPISTPVSSPTNRSGLVAQQRPSSKKLFGFVEIAALGGVGSCGNCGYISFQTKAFDQLVLAEDKKELIRAVARNSGGSSSSGGGGGGLDDDDDDSDDDDSDDDDDFEDVGIDVVANKGGASIFLLHGPPGCGKTLTAEAIAELLEKPLYIVTAGDLGISASDVGKNLGSVLELCQTWDALVLIDEADVFLEARSSTEIERNALVCVMLRLLEYYSGCLFLSSNRSASSIDAAIASRITVMLNYPQLDANGRAKIWKNLIELVPALPIDPDTGKQLERIVSKPRKACKYRADFSLQDYRILAESFELNGRQIKNSIVLSRALARERKTPLNMTVLNRAVVAVAGEDAVAQRATTPFVDAYNENDLHDSFIATYPMKSFRSSPPSKQKNNKKDDSVVSDAVVSNIITSPTVDKTSTKKQSPVSPSNEKPGFIATYRAKTSRSPSARKLN